MLTDSYDRQFAYVRLSITDACNFKCTYCLPNGYQRSCDEDFLRLDEIKRLVRGLADSGVTKIRITGGEPGLRKDLTNIIDVVANTSGIKEIALTTNGFNTAKNIADWQAAGLTQLNVSMDSLVPEQFQLITGSRQFTRVMAGVERSVALGIPTKINTVLLAQYNLTQWQHFLQWVKDMPVSLRFIELMETGDNSAYFSANHVSAELFYAQLQKQGWTHITKSTTAGPAQVLSHPDFAGTLGFIMPYSKDFCASCNRLRITSRGALHACLFASEGHSLRHLLQDDVQAPMLQHWLQQQLHNKAVSHRLEHGDSGATTHLAMLGG